MTLGDLDSTGRPRPFTIPESEFFLEADSAILAIGQGPKERVAPRIRKNEKGLFLVDPETGKTSFDVIYAGGDIVRGFGTVVQAVGDGRRAALAISKYLRR